MPALAALSAMVSKIFRVDLVCGSTRSIRVSRISSAGTTKSVALSTSNIVQSGPASRVLHHERQFGLDAGGDETVRRHEAAIGKEHVVEQHAGIRLVDIERALHRLRGQADLVALDDAALGDLHLDPRLLDRIGVRDRDAGMFQRNLPDLLAGFFRVVEPFGGDADFVVGEGHGLNSAKRGCRNMINMLS